MEYSIYTRTYRNGELFTDTRNTDFITALNYIRAQELTDIDFKEDEETPSKAKLIFSGKKGLTVEAEITEPKDTGEIYDITTRIYLDNKEVAKGQDVNFIELLGYIKLHRYEIIERTQGNLTVNGIVFYRPGNRRNRVEALITTVEG